MILKPALILYSHTVRDRAYLTLKRWKKRYVFEHYLMQACLRFS